MPNVAECKVTLSRKRGRERLSPGRLNLVYKNRPTFEKVTESQDCGALCYCLWCCCLGAGKVCGDNKDPKPPGSPWPICQTPVNPLYSAGEWVATFVMVMVRNKTARVRGLRSALSTSVPSAAPPVPLWLEWLLEKSCTVRRGVQE